MVDLSKTIQPKSDQLNADDLIGGPRTIKVTAVSSSSTPEQPISINFEGDNGKPYKPCKSMRRVLVQVWGKDGQSYIGKSMTIFRDERVTFGGAAVGGIRISHMSGLKEKVTLAITVSKANRKPFTVHPLSVQEKPSQEIDPAVKAAGDQAAANGVDAYTAWLATLSPDVKATVKPFHSEWSKKAKAYIPPADHEPDDEGSDEVPFDDEDDDTPSM